MKHHPGSSGIRPLVIGLVNNMPDAALEATERQFQDLLSAASADCPPLIRCFSLREIVRGARRRRRRPSSGRAWRLTRRSGGSTPFRGDGSRPSYPVSSTSRQPAITASSMLFRSRFARRIRV
jgi:hypothetical protein